MSIFFLFQAYPIHPPEKDDDHDPWKVDFLEDCGYKTKLESGVYSVYKNEEPTVEMRITLAEKEMKNTRKRKRAAITLVERV